MRFRTVALALALACGFGTMAEAKKKPVAHKPVKARKAKKAPKAPKAAKHAKVKVKRHA